MELERPGWRGRLSPASVVFLASFAGLFLELALIRWVSSEIRVFSYCKNLVLVACFLGFGVGCMQMRRRENLIRSMFLLMLLILVVDLQSQTLLDFGPRRVTDALARLSGMMIFHWPTEERTVWVLRDYAWLLFSLAWTGVLFLVAALIMVPFGQMTGAGITLMKSPLKAYSINVLGSLAGILVFAATSALVLPPIYWFVPVVLICVWLQPAKHSLALLGIGLAVVVVLLPNDRPGRQEYWSGYQKLVVQDEKQVHVNNIGYQIMIPQARFEPGMRVDRFNMPYAARSPAGDVLIVGAGTGNDVAVALASGATSVVAVEIDPTIYRIGYELHPQKPYADKRVEIVLDDARHFLKTTDRQFDLIVFSHLDSHTVLSSYTNVRLDNYIYTVEAFQEARQRLAPEGILYVSFFAETPFIAARLGRNLTAAFEHAPVALDQLSSQKTVVHRVNFLTGEDAVMGELKAASGSWRGFRQLDYDASSVVPSTDVWPFLSLEYPHIPPMILLISIVSLVLGGGLVWRSRPTETQFDGRLFWLGAAFMLLEVHNVSRLALVFGTTWQVNAWVIGVILGLILIANVTTLALKRVGRAPGRWAVAGLFATLILAYLVPLDWLATGSRLVGGLGATILLCLPIFFAGLVFAQAFDESPAPSFALGWNILGAVLGGMTESVSYIWGIPFLVPLAAVYYAAAVLWPRPAGTAAVNP